MTRPMISVEMPCPHVNADLEVCEASVIVPIDTFGYDAPETRYSPAEHEILIATCPEACPFGHEFSPTDAKAFERLAVRKLVEGYAA